MFERPVLDSVTFDTRVGSHQGLTRTSFEQEGRGCVVLKIRNIVQRS